MPRTARSPTPSALSVPSLSLPLSSPSERPNHMALAYPLRRFQVC
jgi:hypothetical protein